MSYFNTDRQSAKYSEDAITIRDILSDDVSAALDKFVRTDKEERIKFSKFPSFLEKSILMFISEYHGKRCAFYISILSINELDNSEKAAFDIGPNDKGICKITWSFCTKEGTLFKENDIHDQIIAHQFLTGYVVIRNGPPTEEELIEKKEKVVDALESFSIGDVSPICDIVMP